MGEGDKESLRSELERARATTLPNHKKTEMVERSGRETVGWETVDCPGSGTLPQRAYLELKNIRGTCGSCAGDFQWGGWFGSHWKKNN
ncbi:hypothetical protein HY086_05075 [Candidatus Gottesmanbacteria bacterium]|nr:hypothetical protein [Candidatus Gottesmanbacteria bacterium]